MTGKFSAFRYILCFLIILIAPSLSSYAQQGFGGYREGEIICKMEVGYSINIINSTYGTGVKGHQQQTGCFLLSVPEGQDAESLATVIDARPDVAYCRLNYLLMTPESLQRSQPFLDVEGIGSITLQSAAVNLDLSEAQTLSTGLGVKIAHIDGGVNFLHPLFDSTSAILVSRWDFVDNDSDASDEPGGTGSGHGTFIAGILNLTAPGAEILVYRALDTGGIGDGFSLASAVLMAVEDSCRVINLSFGMTGIHNALDDALRFAKSSGVNLVAAAGNDSTDSPLVFPFPADRGYCLAVAALDSLNLKAGFSNFGDKIDLCAPGTAIYSAYLDTNYAWWEGTSFAAPFVSGLAALLISRNQALLASEVDTVLSQTAVNIDSLNIGYEGLLGHGLIDFLAALSQTGTTIYGDANGDLLVNILDAIYIISYLYKDGPQPYPLQIADTNNDGKITILDTTYLLAYLYKTGPPPVQ